ncbi:YdbL family protein [Marinibactrum halimedae]|uniref:DUF1318 domain-containing protein n=1 Tax=Marinibactrum halimedae TaxID=1444977 RepID=A0AA37TCL5_9GAMM|nr:YdbL family protein [Marinibactrum halimedae]MCD9459038.1 YdbL family protein [Marinibactrum halimedae]GLS26832.1 hypothetical protein GCM10007877_25510 [Marinibactrum halimedae]
MNNSVNTLKTPHLFFFTQRFAFMAPLRIVLFTLLTAFITVPSYALDLNSAKSQGLVGETESGYLAAVKGSPAKDVKALISSINQQRKDKYKAIAIKNNISLQAVENRAGEVAIKKTAAGQYIKKSGKWLKK